MQQLHYPAALSHEDIDITACGFQASHADLVAHAVHSYAHVARMLRHHYTIVLVQINHVVFEAKTGIKNVL